MQNTAGPNSFVRQGCVLGLVSLSSPLAMNMYVPAFPVMAADLDGTSAAIQLSLVSYLAALALGQNIFGPLSDRFGRKPPLYGGLGLFVLASAILGFSQTVEHLIGWRFVQGLGACAALAIARAIVRDLYTGSAAARMMALIILVISIGPLLAPLAGTGLVELFGWRSIFWFMAVAGLLSLLLVFSLIPETLPTANRAPGFHALRGYGSLVRDRVFVCRALMVGCGQATYFAFLAGSPFVIMSLHGLEAWQFSLLFALVAVTSAASAQLGAKLMDRIGAERLIMHCLVTSAVVSMLIFTLALFGVSELIVMMAAVLLVLSSLGIMFPVATVFTLHPHGDVAGSASALIGTTGFGAGALASAMITVLADGSELPMLGTMAGCALLSLACARIALYSKPSSSRRVLR